MLVTLCGSANRFESEFIAAQRELSRRGVLCFSLAVLPCHRGEECWADGRFDKTMADLLYFDRIARSDAIVVLGDGYIGQSTAREILWADIKGKGMVTHKPDDSWDRTVFKLRSNCWEFTLVLRAKDVFGG